MNRLVDEELASNRQQLGMNNLVNTETTPWKARACVPLATSKW
jgi:hypothetical protein